MSWNKGFDFRATSGYVTDPTDNAYVLDTDTYPTTRNGVTFGWTVAPTGARDRVAYTGDSAKVAGIVFGNANGTFRVDLPGAGNYSLRLAMGDAGINQTATQVLIKDNVTTVLTIGPHDTNTDEFWDASDVKRTSNTDWVTNNASVTKTFASPVLNLTLEAATSNSVIAHLFLSQLTSATPSLHQPFTQHVPIPFNDYRVF